jgi:hypothetical protein
LWFLIKLANWLLHRQFDQRNHDDSLNDQPVRLMEPEQVEDEEEPPLGISRSVWSIRHRLASLDLDADTVVSGLVEQGYNANELFLFYDLYFQGQINVLPEDEDPIDFERPLASTTLEK